MLLEFCLEGELCLSNTWSKREEKRKVSFGMGENETEINVVSIKKQHRRFTQNVKAITGDIQHSLVVDG